VFLLGVQSFVGATRHLFFVAHTIALSLRSLQAFHRILKLAGPFSVTFAGGIQRISRCFTNEEQGRGILWRCSCASESRPSGLGASFFGLPDRL